MSLTVHLYKIANEFERQGKFADAEAIDAILSKIAGTIHYDYYPQWIRYLKDGGYTKSDLKIQIKRPELIKKNLMRIMKETGVSEEEPKMQAVQEMTAEELYENLAAYWDDVSMPAAKEMR